MPDTLDCGHEPTPQKPGSCTNGIARGPNGETMCFHCAATAIRREMRETGKATLYLDKTERYVTTWDGQVIRKIVPFNVSRGNFGDRRLYFRFRYLGEVWTGMGQGAGMYCHVRRTKRESVC